MKLRFSLIIGIVALQLALMPVLMHAPSTLKAATEDPGLPLSNSKLFSRLLEESGINNPEYEFTWNDIFGPNKEGQDLYLNVYQNIAVQPEKQALKNTAASTGLTPAEAGAVLSGSIEPILHGKNVQPGMTQDRALQEVISLQNKFAEERDIYALESDLSSELVPTEIFANGDLSDSGFDLIVDLNKIQEILFTPKGLQQTDINKPYSGFTEENGPYGANSGISNPGAGATLFDTLEGGLQTGSPSSGAGDSQNSDGDQAHPDIFLPSSTDDANQCFSDTGLKNALDAFNQNGNKSSSGADNGSSGSGAGNGSSGSGSSGSALGTTSSPLSYPLPAPASKNDSGKSPLCPTNPDGSFVSYCVEVNAIMKPMQVFGNKDECIACHIEKINAAFRETLDHSLIPHTVTGNAFESSVCKQGWSISSLLNMNFILIPMPVITPGNDAALNGPSITDEWNKFWTKFGPLNYETNTDDTNDATQTSEQDFFDRALEQALTERSSQTTQAEILKKVDDIVRAAKAESERSITKLEAEIQVSNQVSSFQSLSYEMDQMIAYFESIQGLLEGISENSCQVLTNKDYLTR